MRSFTVTSCADPPPPFAAIRTTPSTAPRPPSCSVRRRRSFARRSRSSRRRTARRRAISSLRLVSSSSASSAEEHVNQQVRVAPRALPVGLALADLDLLRIGERPEPALADERLVDAAEATRVRGVDGRPQRDGLAVHRAAGRDDQIGERDHALGVDGAVRHDHRRIVQLPHVIALLIGARDYDRVDAPVPSEALEHAREQRIAPPVVEGDVGWRPEHGHDARPVDIQAIESRRFARYRARALPAGAALTIAFSVAPRVRAESLVSFVVIAAAAALAVGFVVALKRKPSALSGQPSA